MKRHPHRQVVWKFDRFWPVEATRDTVSTVVCARCRESAPNDLPALRGDGWLASKSRNEIDPPLLLCPRCAREEAA